MAKVNCAVYVRKSTEKGLELEFNSLHNQEEACRNYILSQSFNEWDYFKTYTDGGISGGTMERPALKQMLDDISKGIIKTVVVYKVDRLSRSITDFHNMIKFFEKYNCSFVSITQSFDTSTSMGKLTLNMLLSFAQFEREVASERVRDKIKATKAKGFWTGGNPKLGYDIINKKLCVNEVEANQVRILFETYLKVGSVEELVSYAEQNNIRMKQWITLRGEEKGGKNITSSTMHRILREKLYMGCIENKSSKEVFQGKHKAIVSKELFEDVQKKLISNSNQKTIAGSVASNVLKGKLYDGHGELFQNQMTSKKGQLLKKRYYAIKGLYLPAHQVDMLAKKVVQNFLNADLTQISQEYRIALKQINYLELSAAQQNELTRSLIYKVFYSKKQMTFYITVNIEELKPFIFNNYQNPFNEKIEFIVDSVSQNLVIEEPFFFRKGITSSQYNGGKTGFLTVNENHSLMVRAFAYAWRYKELHESGMSLEEISKQEKHTKRTIYKYLNLSYLSPKLINSIMAGTTRIDLQKLFEISSKYTDFSDQEKAFA